MLHMLDTDTASYIIKGRSPVGRGEACRRRADGYLRVGRYASRIALWPQAPASRASSPSRRAQFLHIVRVLAWDSDAADYYADIRHKLVTTGQPIGELDMMIAAHSLSAGAVLVTNNMRHYERIDGLLALVNWAAPDK